MERMKTNKENMCKSKSSNTLTNSSKIYGHIRQSSESRKIPEIGNVWYFCLKNVLMIKIDTFSVHRLPVSVQVKTKAYVSVSTD